MAHLNRTPRSSGTNAEKSTGPARAHHYVHQNTVGQDGGASVGLTDREPNVDSELNETSGSRCTGMSVDTAADGIPELCDQLSLAPLTHPFAGPLLTAAQAVLEIFDGDLGINDENCLPVIEARRILYGTEDGFVAAHTASEARRLIRLGKIAANDETPDGDIFGRPVPLSDIETELGAGLRLLGRLVLNGQEPPLGGRAVEVSGSAVPSPSEAESHRSVATSQPVPVLPATSSVSIALSVAAFASRWNFSKRQMETFIRQGMPIHGEGRCRRIMIAEGDEWMRTFQDPVFQRAAETAKRHSAPKKGQ